MNNSRIYVLKRFEIEQEQMLSSIYEIKSAAISSP